MKIFYFAIIVFCISCNGIYSKKSVFDNKQYNLSYINIDKGKFSSSYWELTRKETGDVKVLDKSPYNIYMDSAYIYYYHVGIPGSSYFFDVQNNQTENSCSRDTILKLKELRSSKLLEEVIYFVKDDSLVPFQKINTINSYYSLKSGKYYIPYPGIFYQSKIALPTFFEESK